MQEFALHGTGLSPADEPDDASANDAEVAGDGNVGADASTAQAGAEEKKGDEGGRPTRVDLDVVPADSDGLGPLGRAWVAWTKSCRRPLKNVRVTPTTAVLLNNRDSFGRVVDVVDHLTYTAPTTERKQVKELGPAARFVDQPLSKSEQAANRACVGATGGGLHGAACGHANMHAMHFPCSLAQVPRAPRQDVAGHVAVADFPTQGVEADGRGERLAVFSRPTDPLTCHAAARAHASGLSKTLRPRTQRWQK